MNRGAALPATLFALAITSALAVGGVYVARRHKASALDESAAAMLRPRAESLAIDALVSWDTIARSGQLVGATVMLDSSAETRVWVTRTTSDQYLIGAEALSRTTPVFQHRIGLWVVVAAGRARPAYPRVWSLLP